MSRSSPIEAALRRHRLADVARRTGITLAADTGTVTVRCPLPSHGHPDRTPSLRLYLDHDRYYCFGCAAKGDVIQWARDAQGVGLHDAIQALDSGRSLTNTWAGTTTTTANNSSPRPSVDGASRSLGPGRADTPDPGRTPPERVHAALDAAWGYYTRPALHTRASAYLSARSIDVAVLEAHTGRPETGHTPTSPDGLVNALQAEGFRTHELVDAGLAHRRGGAPIGDFYRQRVLIPIRDDHQRVVGLIGRNTGNQQRWAKYTNPPRTAIYDKSTNLYQPLPPPAHPDGAVIIVEGTLDAMAIAIAAIRSGQPDRFCPVTQSGRELSPTQLDRILAMHAAGPILAFDGDAAGREATRRYAIEVVRRGRRASATVLPDDHDPASWLSLRGADGLGVWSIQRPVTRLRRLHPTGPPLPAPGASARTLSRQHALPPAARIASSSLELSPAARIEGVEL